MALMSTKDPNQADTWQWVKGSWISLTGNTSNTSQNTSFWTSARTTNLMSTGSQTTTGSSAWDRANQISTGKSEIMSRSSTMQENNRTSDSFNLYEKSLTSTSEPLKNQYKLASRSSDIASMIVSVGKDKWYNITGTDKEVINNYLKGEPEAWDKFHEYMHGDQDIKDFAVEMWWIEKPKGNILVNSLWWVVETVAWIPKLLWKGAASLAWWSIKALGWDEQRADDAVNKIKGFIDKIWFWDKDSTAYKVANTIWDIGTLFIPWLNLAKGAQLWIKVASKYPKAAKLIQTAVQWVDAMEKTYPKASKIIEKGLKGMVTGAEDVVKYNAVNQEWTSPEEMMQGWLINIALGWTLGALGKGAEKLWLGWLMTPSKAKDVMKAIKDEWGQVDNLANWMNSRWFKWTKEGIAKQADDWANNAKDIVDELLAASDDVFDSPEATEILNGLIKHADWVPGMESTVSTLKSMLKADGKYTLAELNAIKRQLDKSPLNPFNKWFGDVKSSFTAEWMANLRKVVKEQIEDGAERLGLGDIRALNNEIVVANKLADGIRNKDATEKLASAISSKAWLWTVWWVAWYMAGWDIDSALSWIWVWVLWPAVLKKILQNTTLRTYISNAAHTLSWKPKNTIEQWIWSNGKKTLTEEAKKDLFTIIKESAWDIKNLMGDIILWEAKKWSFIGTNEVVDAFTE